MKKGRIFRVGAISLLCGVLVATLFLAGCTTLKEAMSSWEGRPADELLAEWGAPDSSIKLDNGGKVLTWTTLWNDGNYGVHTCRKSFTVDSKGIITRWSYNDCQELLWK